MPDNDTDSVQNITRQAEMVAPSVPSFAAGLTMEWILNVSSTESMKHNHDFPMVDKHRIIKGFAKHPDTIRFQVFDCKASDCCRCVIL